jgi:hypothetical protein
MLKWNSVNVILYKVLPHDKPILQFTISTWNISENDEFFMKY